MSFIRPEATARMRQWQGVIIGVVLLAIGIWFAARGFGALAFLGYAMVIAGVALGWAGWQRARIQISDGGPGLVEVKEKQLSYFAAEGGVRFSLNDVVKIEIVTTDVGPFADDMFWLFELKDRSLLRIPSSAEGGEALIDVLAGFPGADYEAVIKASGSTARERFLIWQKGD